MHVVICGAGAIGSAAAWYLASGGARVTLVERAGVAAAASGKSGGFLALDWCRGTPLDALARRSFALHEELAAMPGADWGWRGLDSWSVAAAAGKALGRPGRSLPGLDPAVALSGRLGTPLTTAGLHPARFTQALAQAAQARGARLVTGAVTGIARSADGARLQAVEIDGAPLACDAAVIALGPWSILATPWLPLPAVWGLKGHSLVFDAGGAAPDAALFAEYEEPDGTMLTPELFARADGTTYVCAISTEAPLPVDPTAVRDDPGAFARLEALCRRLSPALVPERIVARQACFRPMTRDGLPLIGAVPGVAGAFVATGHNVWGMLNAPATGEALAELILDGAARTVDLAPFDPARLPPFDPARLGLA